MADSTWLDSLIRGFESQTVPKEQWHHREHLAMTVYYLQNHDFNSALEKVRTGLQKLAAAYGVTQTPSRGYHETVTVLLVTLVAADLGRIRGTTEEKFEVISAKYRDSKAIVAEYYSEGVISSWKARKEWVEPDLKPLPKVGLAAADSPR